MKTDPSKPTTIDEYIAGFPPEVQRILQTIRAMIHEASPEAAETIKYLIPTFTLNGNMISFAAYKKHVGIYPIPGGTEKFSQEIGPYRNARSTARFPLDKPIPYALIDQLISFRVNEHTANVAAKSRNK